MIRLTLGTAGLLLAGPDLASAGGLDRSGQGVGIIFEEGNVVELSYGFVAPSVNGTFTNPLGAGSGSGDVGADYSQLSLALKYDVADRLSFAVILDQPFGADVEYGEADATYPLAGSDARFESRGLTAVGRYEVSDAFSVHAGVRHVVVDASLLVQFPVVTPAGPVLYAYDGSFEEEGDTGFVAGAAYERDDIALRVALTYSSELEFSHETTFGGTASGVGDTTYTLPRSVNLDAQTGIAAGTLLFGSVRWADWSETEINAFGYADNPVVGYDEDVYTYTLGLGRELTDSLSGAVSVTYESAEGGLATNLDPTDGNLGFSVGGTYALDAIEITGGVRYVLVGEATTRSILAEFEDNDAVAVGLSVAYRF